MQQRNIVFSVIAAGLAMFLMAVVPGALAVKAATSSTTAPTASSGSITVNSGVSTTAMLSASDPNTPALPLNYSLVTSPANGTVTNLSTSTGSFTYTSNSGFTGTDSFTFMVGNGTLNSNNATETITVNAVTSSVPTSTTSTTATGTVQLVRVDQPTTNLVEGGSFTVAPTLISPSSTMGGLTVMVSLMPQNTSTSYSQTFTNQTLTQNVEATFPLTVSSSAMGTYTVQAAVSNASGTVATFNNLGTVVVMASSSQSTSTDMNAHMSALEARIKVLEDEVARLMQQVQSMLGGSMGGGTTGNGTSTSSGMGATLTPSSATMAAGSAIDFNGRNFGHEESVRVMMDGNQTMTAHADGGGNFTTGAMQLPGGTGTHTFTFTGANSGISMSSTITVK